MKKLLLAFFYLLVLRAAFAQAPQAFKYQAIARNSSGTEMANTNLNVRVSIHNLSATGNIIYQETFSVTTNQFGLFNLNIGNGLPSVGTFTAIQWGNGNKFIEQEIDFGNGFQSIGTSQLLSVPYALYAEKSGGGSGWSLTGNVGTVDTVNFIGTTDNVPLNFRVNNQRAGRIDNNSYSNNTFYGYQSGNSITYATNNTGAGFKTLSSNFSGNNNTAFGSLALSLNIGQGNTATGAYSLGSNGSGNFNTATGLNTLFKNTTGSDNTAIGVGALYYNTSGGVNTVTGSQGMEFNTTGSENTAYGFRSLYINSTGYYNSAFGTNALAGNTTGGWNTAVGYKADVSSPTLFNASAIGANAVVSASNCLVLGNNANVGIGVSAPTAKLEVAGQVKITGGSPGQGKVLTSDATGLASWQPANGTNVSGWSINGNAGTIDTVNFIGTTDNVPLSFRVNNQRAGTIDHLRVNTYFGYHSGYSNTTGVGNTAYGFQAMYSTTSGYLNTAFGTNALYSNTSGGDNVAIGEKALYLNTQGGSNVAVGWKSIYSNTTGYSNTAIGWQSLYNNKTGVSNTATGQAALFTNNGSYNTASGYEALALNYSGNSNVAIGVRALFNTPSGSNLVAIGDSALYKNGIGASNSWDATANTAVGSKALYSNTIGYYNTALGFKALSANVNGINNVANGYYALQYNTSGFQNTAVGAAALNYNTQGYENTANGNSSLLYNTTGNYNIAVGSYALAHNVSGSYNTAIGYWASYSGGFTNTTALGFNSGVTASYQVRIGDATITSIGGQVGWTTLSDGRFKKNISETVPGLTFITKLRPVTYHIDPEAISSFLKIPDSLRMKDGEAKKASMLQTGFIAQEVEKAAAELGFDFSGVDKPKNENDYYGLRYAEFVVPLVKSVQELAAQNAQLRKELEELKAQLKK